MRDGVSASRVAVSAGPWFTVADFLAQRMPSVDDWLQRLQQGEVLDASGLAVATTTSARPGMLLWYWRKPAAEPVLPFAVDVLFQDEHLVIADKPHFMSVTPGGRHLHETVLVRLKRQLGLANLVPMHRLDRETAGVMAFVVRPEDRNAYQGLLRTQQVHKVYEAITYWRPGALTSGLHSSCIVSQDGERFMQMLTSDGPPNAHTRFELVRHWQPAADTHPADASPSLAHWRLTPLTGRKHQLRVHLCELGMPIVGDRIYPRLWPATPAGEDEDHTLPLQLLARELAFMDPVTGKQRCFQSQRQLLCLPSKARAGD